MSAVRALEALAHERTVARLKQESDDINTSMETSLAYSLPYDPASVFLLETMVSIACQTPQYIEEIWQVLRFFWVTFCAHGLWLPLGLSCLNICLHY